MLSIENNISIVCQISREYSSQTHTVITNSFILEENPIDTNPKGFYVAF